ncbi:MAG: PD-(D/E)XK nuclease family protein, partial [Dehalococcoidia bacterium]|nr:PD-(D/E)XK nuclease family protein [Dehalococcoidia bacterium]
LTAALADLGTLLDATPRRPAEHAARLDAALFGTGSVVRAVTEDYPTLDVEVQALRREFAAIRAVDQEVGQEPVTLPAFVDALDVRMQRPSTLIRQPGGVLLAPMHTLHGLRFRHVLVGGLSEGEFPVPRRTDTFLDAEARAALATAGLVLPPEPRASEDELWRTAITRATDATTLWRARLDAKGRPAAASYFFDAAVPEVAVARVEAALQPERTASVRELAISLTSQWPGEARRPKEMAAWDAIVRAAPPVEQGRRSFEPAGRYEGQVPGVDVGWLMEPEAGWSASRLESYRTCSFQFFAHYALQLDELREEREQADAGTRGNIIHEILEDAVASLVESGRALTPETVEVAVARLRERARGLWDAAPARFAFGRAALWRYEGDQAIHQMEDLLRREAATSATLGLDRIVGGEAAFTETIEGDPPLLIQARIDRLDEGPRVIQIVDYKSGRFIPRKDAESGDKLQLQLYALVAGQARAAERVVARYAFLRLKPGESEWSLDTDRPEDAAMLAAAAQVARDVHADA